MKEYETLDKFFSNHQSEGPDEIVMVDGIVYLSVKYKRLVNDCSRCVFNDNCRAYIHAFSSCMGLDSDHRVIYKQADNILGGDL